MSQRLGMADGRCFSIGTANQLLNDYVMQKNGIQYQDNYQYRQLLQKQGPQLVTKIQEAEQGKGPCNTCDKPLLKMPGIY